MHTHFLLVIVFIHSVQETDRLGLIIVQAAEESPMSFSCAHTLSPNRKIIYSDNYLFKRAERGSPTLHCHASLTCLLQIPVQYNLGGESLDCKAEKLWRPITKRRILKCKLRLLFVLGGGRAITVERCVVNIQVNVTHRAY